MHIQITQHSYIDTPANTLTQRRIATTQPPRVLPARAVRVSLRPAVRAASSAVRGAVGQCTVGGRAVWRHSKVWDTQAHRYMAAGLHSDLHWCCNISFTLLPVVRRPLLLIHDPVHLPLKTLYTRQYIQGSDSRDKPLRRLHLHRSTRFPQINVLPTEHTSLSTR